MPDEQRLKDAKIQVKLDLSGARRDLDEAEGDRSGPGGRKPSPGRKDERERKQRERRKRQATGPRTVLAAGAAGRAGIAAKVIPFLKGLVLSNVSAAMGDILPGMIDKRMASLESSDTAEKFALEAARIASLPAQYIAEAKRLASQGLAYARTYPGVFAGQALGQQAAFGESRAGDAQAVASIQAQVASIEAFMRGEQLRLAGRLKGATAVDLGDSFKKFLTKRFGTNR